MGSKITVSSIFGVFYFETSQQTEIHYSCHLIQGTQTSVVPEELFLGMLGVHLFWPVLVHYMIRFLPLVDIETLVVTSVF